MSHTVFEVRAGAYFDSVLLMQLQRSLADLPEVVDAGVVMATPANLDLLAAGDLLPPAAGAGPDDLLLVVRAASAAAAQAALDQVDDLLRSRRSVAGSQFRPRSLATAAAQAPDAGWVLVSVPGRYAAGVARDALALNRHVFLYSDNVSLEEEIDLKTRAGAKGLLVMGPDCGTALIQGFGLGFANRVRRGDIGLVGASGTGLQAITATIHELGGGVSHALGTGGRDLTAAVGGQAAQQALSLLATDAATSVIVLVSKPPDPTVAANLLAAARRTGKPTVIYFQGLAAPARQIGPLHFATNLSEAAALAVSLDRSPIGLPATLPHQGYLRGLFAGGTLAYETILGLQLFVPDLYANLHAGAARPLADVNVSQAHTIIDMGEDTFTQGRLHPMMDNDLRRRRLAVEMADLEVGLIVLDVVLGEGAHPDPSAELAPVIAAGIKARPDLTVLALVIGTDDDPQSLPDQVDTLTAAGAHVLRDTTELVAYLSQALAPAAVQLPAPSAEALAAPFAAINVGVATFFDSLSAQGAPVVQVDWRPPAGGKEDLMALLARMKGG